MSGQDTFGRILVSLYDAMLDDVHWPTTSALIDEACGVTGNAIMVGEGPKEDLRVLFVGLYYRGRRDEDLEREYLEVYHPIDERMPRHRQLPDSKLVHITELYTGREGYCPLLIPWDSSIREVRFLLESDQAQSLSHLVSLEKVTTALPTLDDSTLTDLADRNREANDQIRDGAILPIIFWGADRSVHEQNEAQVDDEERRGAQFGNRWQEARWTGAHPEAREPDE